MKEIKLFWGDLKAATKKRISAECGKSLKELEKDFNSKNKILTVIEVKGGLGKWKKQQH